MSVLVAYGSKMGGTEGITHTIQEQLVARGFTAEVRAARKAPPVDPFGASVVGGALYTNRWHRDARRFVRRNTSRLRGRPCRATRGGRGRCPPRCRDSEPAAE